MFKKIEREFLDHCAELNITNQLNKEELFELLVRFGYLKTVEMLTSSYVAHENIIQFERICKRIGSNEQLTFDLKNVKAFVFGLNFMW